MAQEIIDPDTGEVMGVFAGVVAPSLIVEEVLRVRWELCRLGLATLDQRMRAFWDGRRFVLEFYPSGQKKRSASPARASSGIRSASEDHWPGMPDSYDPENGAQGDRLDISLHK